MPGRKSFIIKRITRSEERPLPQRGKFWESKKEANVCLTRKDLELKIIIFFGPGIPIQYLKKQEHHLVEGDQEIIFGISGKRISETDLF